MTDLFFAGFIILTALVILFSKPKMEGDNFIIAALGAMAVIGLLLSF